MNIISKIILSALLCAFSLNVSSQTLKRQGNATQLIINGKPMLILGGEVSNSAATSVKDIEEWMPRMKEMGLNTVLVPAYWEFIEPTEGHFDFTLTDKVIAEAKKNDLKVVFLWFGAWKNSMSCYAPSWFKTDTKRFPRSMTRSGKPLEIASVFSDNVFNADCKAFTTWLRHTKNVSNGTVIMIQIENEIGMLEDARDYSPEAQEEFAKWKGKDTGLDNDERFMATHYARYVEKMAQAARKIWDIPFYVNAAMNSRGRKPGEYPSAGPLAHLMDIWKKEAPTVDFMAPDIYDTGFASWASQYATDNNPLFIPETKCCENSGVRALYTFGEYEALGFSPFAIDQTSKEISDNIRDTYGLLKQLSPLFFNYQGKGAMHGLLFDQENKERVIDDDGIKIIARHNFTLPWDPRATDGSVWPEGGGLIIRLSPLEYIVAGNGIVVEFKTEKEYEQTTDQKLGEDGFAEKGNGEKGKAKTSFKGKRLGFLSVDQVNISNDGSIVYLRRDNGDQDHQGRHARIGVGEQKILHVKLYEY